ncbi:MAG: hypothetical protein DSY47_01635 [Hydrogenothermus sp.]|nr:MAG: hypothetical protein DSY47_01635 [Hydrogenothermus sp.]
MYKSRFIYRFIFFIVGALTFSFIVLFSYEFFSILKIKDKELQEKYENNKKSLSLIKEEQRKLIYSMAFLIASQEEILKEVNNNNKTKLYYLLKDKWDVLKREFKISELHIVDKNGKSIISFTNTIFGDIQDLKDNYLLDLRFDVKKSLETGKPISSLFVCKYFYGIRYIYPLQYKDKIVGALSIGKSLDTFLPILKKHLNKEAFLIINKDSLKNKLLPEIFSYFNKNYKDLNNFLIIGRLDPIFIEDLKLAFKEISTDKYHTPIKYGDTSFLLSLYPIKDYEGKNIGFVAILEDVSLIFDNFYKSVFSMLAFYLVMLISLIVIIFLVGGNLENRIKEIIHITENISNKNFSVLEKYSTMVDEKLKKDFTILDEIDFLKLHILKTGEELKDFIESLNTKIKKYAKDSLIDPLTKVLNRRALSKIIENVFDTSKLKKVPISVILMDIDYFKKINDTYGHDIGDIVLKDFAETVKDIISKRDYLIRLGGEEFAVILPGANLEKAREIAEKIRKAIESRSVNIEGKNIKYTVSIGVEEAKEEDKNIYEIIIRADKKLYEAKKTGRNKVVA